jgi:hypothetical protein
VWILRSLPIDIRNLQLKYFDLYGICPLDKGEVTRFWAMRTRKDKIYSCWWTDGYQRIPTTWDRLSTIATGISGIPHTVKHPFKFCIENMHFVL